VDVISTPGVKFGVPAAMMVVVIVGTVVMSPVEVIVDVQEGVGSKVGIAVGSVVAVWAGTRCSVLTGIWVSTGGVSVALPPCPQAVKQTRTKNDKNLNQKEFIFRSDD
jgi:hypothetical protein